MEVQAPTWRNLPYEPPYGPVPPPRTPNIHDRPAPVILEDEPTVSAKQIALWIAGVALLIALAIGATLLLLDENEDDEEVAQSNPPPVQEDPPPVLAPPPTLPPSPDQTSPPLEPAPAPTAPEPQPQPSDPAEGELTPNQPPPEGQTPEGETPGGPTPEGGEPGGETPPGQGEAPEQDQPDAIPPPETPPEDQPDLELPRIFELRRLPAGTAEGATTLSQTSSGDDETEAEQTTMLDTDDGEEYSIVATRADDVVERYEGLVENASAELTVSGQDAILTEDGDLAYVVDGETPTLIVIDGPDTVEADALVTVAQGLELLQ